MSGQIASIIATQSTDQLATQIPIGQAIELTEIFLQRGANFLPNLVGAGAVFIIGLWLASWVKKLVKKWFARSNQLDETLEGFLCSFAYYGVVALVVVTTLGMFGVQTTSLAAAVGAAGLAIGLALQGTLGHLASGVMLLAFRPFKLGDYVHAAGHEGTVKAITLFTTELATTDNKKIIMPNTEVWASSIVNHTAYNTRRIDLIFGVSYAEDIDRVNLAILDQVSKDNRILQEPSPAIGVNALGDSAVEISIRVWVQTGDFLRVKWALTKAIKERFDAENIEVPFPTRTIIERSQ